MKPKCFPAGENEFAKKAKKMKIPSMYDNVDYGKKTKIVPRKVSVVDGRSGEVFGVRAIMTKETVSPLTFTEYLLEKNASTDLSMLPDVVIGEIRSNIRKGAKDLAQDWANALELVHRAYYVSNVKRPTPDQSTAWRQYEELIKFAVKQLADSRGLAGKWRASEVMVSEAVKERRFFVHIPGQAAVEVTAPEMDDVIDDLVNKMRRHGVQIRIKSRDEENAILTMHVGDEQREEIRIQNVS